MSDSPVQEDASLESLVGRVADEFLALQERGERPEVEEYAARYPEAAPLLRKVLASLQVLDRSWAGDPGAALGVLAEAAVGTLGDFRILREVGRGGMGVVYEAEQISLNRRVALKVLPFAAALDSKQLQRFKNEAQAAAQLHHTNIVPVFGVGCERGLHFYAMQFIDGQTLAALIHDMRHSAGRDEKAPARADPLVEERDSTQAALTTQRSAINRGHVRTVTQLAIQAAQALEHAHQQGVVHRDIKPANLMVDVRGNLWITDFGLAQCHGDAGLTRTGDLLGTLRYMSPEQARARHALVDHRTDVYSLGATLYELLTLEPAFAANDRHELLMQIALEEPRPLRHLNKAVPAELETIVLKAMAKNPEERYATAQELADDLKRFLEDQPIRAKRPSLRQRAVKWARRHKTVVRAALVVLALAVVALAISTALIWKANTDLKQSLERERQNAYRQRIALAEREWSANNLSRMQELLDECPPDLRGWEWYYLWRLRYKALPPLHHDSAVLCAVFSPDGRRIASSDQEGWVKVWNAQTGRELLKFRAHREHARTVAFSPDGRRLATASYDGTAKTWDAQTGQQLPASKRHEGVVGEAVFSPDGRYLASGGSPGASGASAVAVWDAASGDDVRTLPCPNKWVWSIAFSPDGKRLAANGMDPTIANVTVTVWDVQTGQKQFTLRHADESCVAFSPDGRLLASGGKVPNVGVVKVWDAQTGRELHNLRGHTGAAPAVAFSPDGRRLASGSQDQTVKLWDLRTGQECLTLRGHSGRVFKVAFSPDGHRLVSASGDRTVRVWDARPAEGEPDSGCLTLRGHSGAVNNVAFHPSDPSVLASAGADSTVRFWDARSGKQLRVLQVDATNLRGLVFSPRGERFAAAGQADTVRIWDTTTGQEVPPSPLACVAGGSLAFSPDGRRLALGRFSKRPLLIWDAASGELIRELPNTWTNASVAFSPDSRRLATSNADGMVRIWDVTTGKEAVSPPLQHGIGVTSVAFSPDGQRLASAGTDRTVKVWDTTTWKPVLVLSDPTGTAQGVAFAPDSRRLAWGSSDSTVKVADAIAGQILETMRGHSSWVTNVAFSPDGQQIASSSADGTVKIWKAPPIRGTAH